MRAVKSTHELEFIKQAQSLTEQTLDYILPRIATGRTEREIMLDMEKKGIRLAGGCCGTTPAHIAAVKKAL